MKFLLAPSILAADFNILGSQMHTLEKLGVTYAHIDVMDGHFVPNISFGFPVIESIRKNSNLIFDVHLMISEPEKYASRFAKCGADIINFHIEATKQPDKLIEQITGLSKKAAVTIKPCTQIEAVFPYLDKISMVLIMSVEPGFGGQPFMPSALKKAEILRKYIIGHNLNVDIEIDGGICLDNVDDVLNAGVNIIVAGSSVFNNDMEKSIAEFNKKLKVYEI